MGRKSALESVSTIQKKSRKEKDEEDLAKLSPTQLKIRNDILIKEGLITDAKGKNVLSPGHNVKNVKFESAPNNMTLIVKKYAKGYTPFMETQAVKGDYAKLFLGDDEDFKKFSKSMQQSQVRNYLKLDGSTYNEYVKGECDQPLQVRIMGSLDDVRRVSKTIISAFNMKDKIFNDKGNINAGYFGLSKLECSKKNRNKTYCQDSIRAYINDVVEATTDEGTEEDTEDTKHSFKKTVCKRFVGTSPDELEHTSTFENSYATQIKLDGKLRDIIGKIDHTLIDEDIMKQLENHPSKVVKSTTVNGRVKSEYVIDSKVTSWENNDVIIYYDDLGKIKYKKL